MATDSYISFLKKIPNDAFKKPRCQSRTNLNQVIKDLCLSLDKSKCKLLKDASEFCEKNISGSIESFAGSSSSGTGNADNYKIVYFFIIENHRQAKGLDQVRLALEKEQEEIEKEKKETDQNRNTGKKPKISRPSEGATNKNLIKSIERILLKTLSETNVLQNKTVASLIFTRNAIIGIALGTFSLVSLSFGYLHYLNSKIPSSTELSANIATNIFESVDRKLTVSSSDSKTQKWDLKPELAWEMLTFPQLAETYRADIERNIEAGSRHSIDLSKDYILLGAAFSSFNLDEALKAFKNALIRDSQSYIAAMNIARTYAVMGKPQQAREYSRKAKNFPQTDDPTELVLRRIMEATDLILVEDGSFELVQSLFREAFKIAKDNDLDYFYFSLIRDSILLSSLTGNIESANTIFSDDIGPCGEIRRTRDIGLCWETAAALQFSQGNEKIGIEQLKNALAAFVIDGNTISAIRTRNKLTFHVLETEGIDASLKWIDQILAEAKSLKFLEGEISGLTSLYKIQADFQGKYEQALTTIDLVLKKLPRALDKSSMRQVLWHGGMISLSLEDYERAINFFERAMVAALEREEHTQALADGVAAYAAAIELGNNAIEEENFKRFEMLLKNIHIKGKNLSDLLFEIYFNNKLRNFGSIKIWRYIYNIAESEGNEVAQVIVLSFLSNIAENSNRISDACNWSITSNKIGAKTDIILSNEIIEKMRIEFDDSEICQ